MDRKSSLVYHHLLLDLLPNRHLVSSYLPGKPTFSNLHLRYLPQIQKILKYFRFIYLFVCYLYVYGCFAPMYAMHYVSAMPTGTRRWQQIPSDWSYKWFAAWSHECWMLNSGPLEEEPQFSDTEDSYQSPESSFHCEGSLESEAGALLPWKCSSIHGALAQDISTK